MDSSLLLGKTSSVSPKARPELDIAGNRRAAKYSAADLLRRALWGVATPLFRWSPRVCFGWRRFLLRVFGARVGQEVHVYGSAVIYMPWNLEIGDWSSVGERALLYNLGKVSVGKKATISHGAHLCAGTHDYTRTDLPLVKAPILIGDSAWICADAFVGPGVVVGEGAVVGARAVAVRSVAPWTVVAGNPAKEIGTRRMEDRPV